jgi:hypothetical protein
MAGEYTGDIYDFENMTDEEVRGVVLEHLREQTNLDADDIEVLVQDGTVTLTGRVGTDAEVQIAGELLDDVLGLDRYSNELVVDELRRGTSTLEEDLLIAAPGAEDQLGGSSFQQSDTAEHLVEDLDAETQGTHDVSRAIRDAAAYRPPDSPIGDGYGSREDH